MTRLGVAHTAGDGGTEHDTARLLALGKMRKIRFPLRFRFRSAVRVSCILQMNLQTFSRKTACASPIWQSTWKTAHGACLAANIPSKNNIFKRFSSEDRFVLKRAFPAFLFVRAIFQKFIKIFAKSETKRHFRTIICYRWIEA